MAKKEEVKEKLITVEDLARLCATRIYDVRRLILKYGIVDADRNTQEFELNREQAAKLVERYPMDKRMPVLRYFDE